MGVFLRLCFELLLFFLSFFPPLFIPSLVFVGGLRFVCCMYRCFCLSWMCASE